MMSWHAESLMANVRQRYPCVSTIRLRWVDIRQSRDSRSKLRNVNQPLYRQGGDIGLSICQSQNHHRLEPPPRRRKGLGHPEYMTLTILPWIHRSNCPSVPGHLERLGGHSNPLAISYPL